MPKQQNVWDRVKKALPFNLSTTPRGVPPKMAHHINDLWSDQVSRSAVNSTLFNTRGGLRRLYNTSHTVKKIVDIPAEDATVRWRSFTSTDDAVLEAMKAQEVEWNIKSLASRAIKTSRLYGSACIFMLTKNAPQAAPLVIDEMVKGDLANLLLVDRFHMSAIEYDEDPFSRSFSKPSMYRIEIGVGGERRELDVHGSRAILFDGVPRLSVDDYRGDQTWGESALVSCMIAVRQDESIAADVAFLVEEASVPVISTDGFKAFVAQSPEFSIADHDVDPDDMSATNARLKSIYRTMYLDTEDSYQRVSVNFNDLPRLIEVFEQRLAGAADIPATRFWAESPAGLDATGESDLRNYALKIGELQRTVLDPALNTLDRVLLRDAGASGEPPEHKWLSLIDLSDQEEADVAMVKSSAVSSALASGIVSVEEARNSLDGDPLFGTLRDIAPEQLEKQEDLIYGSEEIMPESTGSVGFNSNNSNNA